MNHPQLSKPAGPAGRRPSLAARKNNNPPAAAPVAPPAITTHDTAEEVGCVCFC